MDCQLVWHTIEHPSVQRPLEDLAKRGYNVTVVKPRADGTLDINEMLVLQRTYLPCESGLGFGCRKPLGYQLTPDSQ